MFAEHVYSASEPELALNTPADHMAIEGSFDPLSQRVDLTTGQVVDHQPPQPSSDHEWHVESRRWRLTATAVDKKMRRELALKEIARLELKQCRAMREYILGRGGADTLREIDDEIARLRADL